LNVRSTEAQASNVDRPKQVVNESVAESTADHNRHFRTDHLMSDLKGRSIRGGAVTLSSQGIKFALQTGSTMVLARLLVPSDFGLIAMVTALTGLVTMFKDAGLSLATVQHKDITHDQVSTLFWINVALSSIVMLVIAAAAPAISAFYAEPRLMWITLALAVPMLFGGLTVQHQALLRRQMRFSALAVVEIATLGGGIAVAIAMALLGFGYWSLVGMTAAAALTNAILVWALCDWRPGRPRRGVGVRPLLTFGLNATGASFLNYIGANLDNVLIGWWSGPATLGLYSKAYGLLTMPLRQVSAPMGAVAIPALSRLIDDEARYRRAFVGASQQMLAFTTPMVVFGIVFAGDVIFLLLGPHWESAGRLFAILGFAGLILPYWNATGWVWVSQGRMQEHLRFHCIDAAFKVLSIVIGLPWGAEGVAVGVAVRYYLVIPILFAMLGRRGPLRKRDLYSVLAYPTYLGIVAAATCLAVRLLTVDQTSGWLRIGIAALAVGSTWLIANIAHGTGRRLLSRYHSTLTHFRLRTSDD
jgi:PST family polysaccharide transporter